MSPVTTTKKHKKNVLKQKKTQGKKHFFTSLWPQVLSLSVRLRAAVTSIVFNIVTVDKYFEGLYGRMH